MSSGLMSDDIELRRRRASYRAAHRGTKEMDWLLSRYAAAKLGTMVDPQLTAFEDFLSAPDPQLQTWIMDTSTVPDDRYAGLVHELRAFHEVPGVGM